SALFFTHHYRPLRSTLFPYTTLFRSCGCPSIREKMICTLRPFKGCRVLESMIRTRISVHITLQLLQQNAVGCSVDTLLSWPRLVVVTAAARLGPVISPLLCNVYLHYVFDLWVQHWRTHRATGEVI